MKRLPQWGAFALVLTALFAASTASAADAKLFDYQQIELENGLKVVTLEDSSCPVVAVQVWYHVGSRNERPDRQGFAHMFEHMMFRGTDLLEPKEHSDLIQSTGGDCNAGTSFDHTAYINRLPANQIELALWLEAERMAFLAVNQENFDVERKVVEEELRMYRNNPYGTLGDQVLAALFKVHPYRWMVTGQISHLRAASVQELRDFWSTYYVPNNATLVIVGAVKHEDAQRMAKEYFGWITRGADPPIVGIHEPMPTEARRVTFKEDKAPAPLAGIIYRTVPAAHPDYVPLQLLATILGGGESSRLYRDLVADTQDVAIAMAMAMSLEDDGILAAAAILPPFGGKPVDEILDSIAAHIEHFRDEPVSERELTKAKNQMLTGVVLPQLSIMSKADALGEAATTLGDVSRVNDQLEEIRAVTAADIQRVANEYLAPERALRADVKANLLGSLFGGKKDDDGEVTAAPEAEAPPPGRPGVVRPADFPTEPPIADLLDVDTELDLSEHKLPNGMTIIVVPNHEVPYVTVQLGLRSGAWTEDKPGTASLALSMLTKGTDAHDEGQLADELETYAISLGGNAGMDTCSVTLGSLTEQLERGMALMGEVVLTPTFPADELDRMVKQLRTALAVEESTPEYFADRELRRALFGEHPYAREADPESADLGRLSVDDLRQWWKTFARPDDATLIFAGDI
ncbi:MAG: insulinase family protein, partial [Phycisphaerae bacterium]|nr:insulinase family protein [Phycisphaerae bacterium]